MFFELDAHTRTLVESFGGLLRSAKITNPQSTTREDFQINVATASLATAAEGILRQIREVKLAVMLQDEAAMDREVDQGLAKIARERVELEKELEALSNQLKAAYAGAAMAGGNEGPIASTASTEPIAPVDSKEPIASAVSKEKVAPTASKETMSPTKASDEPIAPTTASPEAVAPRASKIGSGSGSGTGGSGSEKMDVVEGEGGEGQREAESRAPEGQEGTR